MSRHYNKAPIVEAVIDLQVDAPLGPFSSAIFDPVVLLLKASYPTHFPITGVQMGFSQSNALEPKFHTNSESVGLRLQSADGGRVLMLQRSGFTFSHMPPYTSWEPFRDEARSLWGSYLDATGAQEIKRAAVRVINRIILPAPLAAFEEYCHLRPQLPNGFSASPDPFYMQLQISQEHLVPGCRAVINCAAGSLVDTGKSELLLDFDLFAESRIDSRSSKLWEVLNKLRDGKNELFEACITDNIRGLIK